MSPATLQKVSLTVRDGFIDWHRLGMLSRRDAMRVGLGWVGSGSGVLLFALSVLVGFAFIPLVHERPNVVPKALPDIGNILGLANGVTFTAAVSPDFSDIRTVRATRLTKQGFFLVGTTATGLTGRVWIYRDEGITEGEESMPPLDSGWRVVRGKSGFTGGWDLPRGILNLEREEASTRYALEDPLPASAVVLVPGAPEELRPGGLWLWWMGFAIACPLLWISAVRGLLRGTRFARNRKALAEHLSRRLGLPVSVEGATTPQ